MKNDRTFALRSYGCQMNDLDAEYMAGLLQAAGWRRTDDFASADAIIINTCAVRGGAEDRALGRLASFKPLKSRPAAGDSRRPAGPVIAITGCVAQKTGQELLEKMPHLDLVVGTRDWPQLSALLERAAQGERLAAIDGIATPLAHGPEAQRRSAIKAGVEVMIGCDNFCSYCVVPLTRGREVSRPLADVVADLRRLADSGYREALLIGQNVNSYRHEGAGLADLLAAANAVDGLDRVRFITSNPQDLTDAIIAAMAGLDKVCESLHLPAQAGSDRVLQAMRRRYSRAHYEDLIGRLRAAMPDIALTTDLLVGFPGETERDFEETLSLQEAIQWDGAFTFMYSPREGTAAFAQADDVPPEEKQRRVAELIRRQEAISTEKNAAMVGREYEVLVEGPASRAEGDLLGRTRGDKPVAFAGGADLIGRLVTVRITESSAHTLRGERREA